MSGRWPAPDAAGTTEDRHTVSTVGRCPGERSDSWRGPLRTFNASVIRYRHSRQLPKDGRISTNAGHVASTHRRDQSGRCSSAAGPLHGIRERNPSAWVPSPWTEQGPPLASPRVSAGSDPKAIAAVDTHSDGIELTEPAHPRPRNRFHRTGTDSRRRHRDPCIRICATRSSARSSGLL